MCKLDLCPYCKTRPRRKATCGDVECQHKHRLSIMRNWWQKNKNLYRGKHYGKNEGAKLSTQT